MKVIFKGLGSAASTSNCRLENHFPGYCCQQTCACRSMFLDVGKVQTCPHFLCNGCSAVVEVYRPILGR